MGRGIDDAELTLRKIGAFIAREFVGQVLVYSGTRPGCGKTFQLRVDAGEPVDVWPVHKHLVVKDLIEALPLNSARPLHIDVSTTAKPTLNDLIFQMVIVGCVSDPVNLMENTWSRSDNNGAGQFPPFVLSIDS